MMNKDKFTKMKKTAIFMNIGRGPTVNEQDLIECLKDKTIAGAVLDVFQVEPLSKDSELWKMDNVFITPHTVNKDKYFVDRSV